MTEILVSRGNFIESLKLPEGVEAHRFNGMNRVHFKYKEKGFAVIDMKASTYNFASRPEYFQAIGITRHDVTYNLGLNRAIIWDIPYSDTTYLFKLINYIVGKAPEKNFFDSDRESDDNKALNKTNDKNAKRSDINFPIVPLKRFYGVDGELRMVCGNCGTEFLQAPRCPECGQLVDIKSPLSVKHDRGCIALVKEVLDKLGVAHTESWEGKGTAAIINNKRPFEFWKRSERVRINYSPECTMLDDGVCEENDLEKRPNTRLCATAYVNYQHIEEAVNMLVKNLKIEKLT